MPTIMHANMRQSPNLQPGKRSPFKRANEVWNKNMEAVVFKTPKKRKTQIGTMPKITSKVLGNCIVRMLQCA
jgi:hypothetical protein